MTDLRGQILSKTRDGFDVFRYYIRGKWREGRAMLNPLYNDTNPSCCIRRDKNTGVYRMYDQGNEKYSGDCFFLVGALNGMDSNDSKSFVKIMKIIDKDLSLGCFSYNDIEDAAPPIAVKEVGESSVEANDDPLLPPPPKEYEVKVRDFMDYELQYWSRYGITLEVLNAFNVVAIDEFKSVTDDGKKYFVRCSKDNMIFGYQRNNFIKVYQPLKSKPHRFLYGGEVPRPYSFGLEQLPSRGDVLYITGGEKDVLSLTSHGFHAICFGSEKWPVPKNVIRKLSFKFKHIVLLYDMDKTGQEYSLKHAEDLKEFGVKRLLLPLPGSEDAKDISDYFKIGHSADDFKMLFINILDSMYNTMAILNSCEVDLSAPPSESLKIISINDVSLGAQGNLLCVTGGEGTGKSNFVGSLISGCINTDQSTIDTLGVDIAPNVQNRAVLLYDTEQSEVQLYKNSVNILRRSQRQDSKHTH